MGGEDARKECSKHVVSLSFLLRVDGEKMWAELGRSQRREKVV